MSVNSIRMSFSSFWFLLFSIIFLLPYFVRAAPALNGAHSGRGSPTLGWELQKVAFLLNELFYSSSGRTVQCQNNDEIARAEAISCIVAMVNSSGSTLENASPYDCRFFQGEYDCIAAAVRGCGGAQSALAHFLSVEQELGQKYGCTLKVDVATTEAPTLRQVPVPWEATQGPSKRRGHRPSSPRKKSNNYVSISASERRHSDSEDTLKVLSTTASFLFSWLPRSMLLATNFEFDD